jgi:hypothetical protein
VGRLVGSSPRSQKRAVGCANTYARNVAGIASKKKTILRALPARLTSAVASRAGGFSYRDALQPYLSATRRGRHPSHPGSALVGQEVRDAATEDACAAALEMGVHEYRFVRRYLERGPQLSLKQVDPLIRELVHYRDLINHRTKEASGMNLIELDRALRQLRLGGMAAVIETRLRQAQAEPMTPIDLISCLVSDELARRSERLLQRRQKQAQFRDSSEVAR